MPLAWVSYTQGESMVRDCMIMAFLIMIANRLESLYRPYHKTLTSVRSPVIPIALSLTCTHTPRNHYHMSFTSMIAVP